MVISSKARFGKQNGMYGRHRSEETKAKIRAKLIGRHLSEERKAKVSGDNHPNFGKHLSEETREKIRDANMGENNAMWKGDKATQHSGRNRARIRYRCPKGMERHHIDGNPLNNTPENIMFVTRKQHMVLDGRLEKYRSRDHISKLLRGQGKKYVRM